MPLAAARSAFRGLLLSLSSSACSRAGGRRRDRAGLRTNAAGAGAAFRRTRVHNSGSSPSRQRHRSPSKRQPDVVARAKPAAVRTLSFAPSREKAPSESSPQGAESAFGPRGLEAEADHCDIDAEQEVRLRAIVTMQPGAAVVCTPEEEELFSTLLAVVKHHELPVTLRVAGGWVRDKLLGKHSSDIDIALDSMLGREFAQTVNEYLESKGEKTHGVGVIQSNPDQSKHLETATMRVHDVWLDLVNLRSENYSEESRIPEMAFGSATDDAYRRDLTINSLFYNINLRCVEDFTGMGLDDLQAGVVRTPLPPRTTFLDDPLRILRAVRFASRFGFSLDRAIVTAAMDSDVQTALRTKVSRERVGKEVSGMLRGPSPGDALTLLCRFQLFDIVFAHGVHEEATAKMPATTAWACMHSMRSLDALLSAHANGGAEPYATAFSCEEREWLVLAAFLAPLRNMSAPGKKNKPTPLLDTVIKEALKLRVKDAEVVNLVLGLADDMRGLLLGGDEGGVVTFTRVDAGRCLRRGKEHWRLALALAAAMDMPGVVALGGGAEVEPWTVESARAPPIAEPLLGGHGSPLHAFSESSLKQDGGEGGVGIDDSSARKMRSGATLMATRLRAAEAKIAAMELDKVWELKPLLNGKEVMKAVGMTKGGPALGRLNEQLIDWQLDNPAATVEEAEAFLQRIGPDCGL